MKSEEPNLAAFGVVPMVAQRAAQNQRRQMQQPTEPAVSNSPRLSAGGKNGDLAKDEN